MKHKPVLFLLSIVLLIFTFPGNDAIIIPQLDTSYLLAYNYMFAHHTDYLQYLTFTFGPLAILKHPLPIGSNLWYGIIFQAILQFAFIYTAFLAARAKNRKLIPFILLMFFFAVLLSFDYYFYGLILFLILFHQKRPALTYVIRIAFLTALACLIKVNIGLISILIFGSYMLIHAFSSRKAAQLLYGMLFTILFFLLMWLLIFGNFDYLWRYISSFVSLSIANSSSLSLNPDNNWYWLSFSLLLFLAVPFLEQDKKTRILYGSILLALFASFKYAMAREDTFHIQTFLDFILLIIFVMLMSNKKLKVVSLLALMLSLFFFYENTFTLGTAKEIKRNLFSGFHNFNRQVLHLNTFSENALDSSLVKLEEQKLPEPVLQLIGESSIDFYPWEVSYYLVNDLNYKPRPMIQSGSLPESIDRINAEYLESQDAAEYMLWEFDQEYAGLTSYDERYQLNSEQHFLQSFFNNFSMLIQDEDFALYKKTGDSLLEAPRKLGIIKSRFREWIPVPQHPNGILQGRFDIEKTFAGKLASALYKDASYYIEYKLKNDAIVKHRFAPSNARAGLWIAPYIAELNPSLSGLQTREIRLSYDERDGLIRDEFSLEWMISEYFKPQAALDSLLLNEGVLYQETLDFEDVPENWHYPGNRWDSSQAYHGSHNYLLDSLQIFSPGFEIYLADHLDSSQAILILDVMARFDSLSKPVLVIEHMNDSGRIAYYSKKLRTVYNHPYSWNNIKFNKVLEATHDSSEKMKIYIWNSNRKGMLRLDDFRLRLVRF
ncbi:MAG: hypothetical protein U5Q03_14775 [Bacteroidota bacterium]|nr:hypothetical protein [Bacteroidota bacterium]